MIITLHAATPAEAIDQVVKEIRRQARANELNNLAAFFARVVVEPPTTE